MQQPHGELVDPDHWNERVELDGRPGPQFAWASLTIEELGPVARAAGFVVTASWAEGLRHFARLEPRRRP